VWEATATDVGRVPQLIDGLGLCQHTSWPQTNALQLLFPLLLLLLLKGEVENQVLYLALLPNKSAVYRRWQAAVHMYKKAGSTAQSAAALSTRCFGGAYTCALTG
jgi:hypothetical protein